MLTVLFVGVYFSVSNWSGDITQTAKSKAPNATSSLPVTRPPQTSTAAQWLMAERPLEFERLSLKQGLSQSTVLCMLQDRQGFMWFGTQDGLNRYDGYGFTVYRHDDTDPDSLRDNYILSIYEDRAGVLWVGTNKGGLNRYDRQTEKFTAYVHDPQNPESLSLNAVTAIVEDQAGGLWVATDGAGVNRFDRQTGKCKRFMNDPATLENRRANIVLALYPDASGSLWLGTELGLSRLDLQTYEYQPYIYDPVKPQGQGQNRIHSITADRDGALWLGTVGGLYRFDHITKRSTSFINQPNNLKSLISNYIVRILIDRQGRLWVGTIGGLDRFEAATQSFTHFVHDPNDLGSLSGDRILSLYEDRAGSLWVAAQDEGLNRYDSQAKPFVNFTHDLKNSRSLAHRNVQAIFEDQAGNLLIGNSEGLDISTSIPGEFTHFSLENLHPQAGRKSVKAIVEDRPGRFWLGLSSGFARFERTDEQNTRTEFFPGKTVLTICVDRAGLLWLGRHGGGLTQFNPDTKQMTDFLPEPQNPQSLSDNLVFTVYEDRAGILWVGTSSGLNRFDRATGTFTRFLHDPNDPHSLSYNLVWTIYEDRAGMLWIGTGGGLNQFDPATQKFTRYTEKEGLPNNNVMGIQADAAGNLWLGTGKGLTRFDPQTKTMRSYDTADGLFGNEVGQGAHYQNSQGLLFFGGPEGFSIFQPDRIQDDPTPPPIVLTACHRYNTDLTSGVALAEKGSAAKSEIEFSYKDNILTFAFAALSFRHPEKNQYAYQLAGYSDQWIQLGTKHEVTFTNLDAGEYTLRVRGSNSDGIWNTGTSLRLIIVPPFWRRWWFMGLEVVAVIGMVWLIYQWRITALERRNAQQQAFSRQLIASQEEERKRIAAELHDSLGQSLAIIKNRALLGLSNAADHDAALEQLQEISEASAEAIGEVKEIAHNLRPYQLDRLGLTKTIEGMIRKVAATSKVAWEVELERIDGLFSPEAEINLFRILQESINNILRHADASQAWVRIRKDAQSVELLIRDNGKGFVPGIVQPQGAIKQGFGLIGIAERIRQLNGEHRLTSLPGKGTTLTIKLNLREQE